MTYIHSDGLQSAAISLKTLGQMLTRPLEKPVVDETGISGQYILNLKYAPPNTPDSPLPDLFTAVQEQLGLKLEPAKVPMDFLVIDTIEKVPAEN